MPVTLFIWGGADRAGARDRADHHQQLDTALNPTHAEAQMTLRVLTPAEIVAASSDDDVLANLAMIAYTYTLTLRQTLALETWRTPASRSSG